MFKAIIWIMKASLELAAFLVVIAGASSGGVIASFFGLGDNGEVINLCIGIIAGLAIAAMLFGIPIIIININENIEKSRVLLEALTKTGRSSSKLATTSFFPSENKESGAADTK
ncbi:MAG: hypothetical protein ACTHNM_06375 [Dyella sp.]|uniref:hypothetical protein n=1 Tax=Dyella sp. TaxID=1869338 RepID=UPI003F820B9D